MVAEDTAPSRITMEPPASLSQLNSLLLDTQLLLGERAYLPA